MKMVSAGSSLDDDHGQERTISLVLSGLPRRAARRWFRAFQIAARAISFLAFGPERRRAR